MKGRGLLLTMTVLIIALSHAAPGPGNAADRFELGGKVSADKKIGGEIIVKSDVIVEKGVTLTIAEGSNIIFSGGSLEVYGLIIAKGTKALPIIFTGTIKEQKNFNGIRIINSKEDESVISNCNFKDLSKSIFVSNSKVLIENSFFESGNIAIDTKQKDETVIKGNTITDMKKVGIFIKNDSKAKMIGNRISSIKKYGIYIYRSKDAIVQDNEIKSCGDGIMIAYVGSDALIQGNYLASNKTGIMIEKGANPVLTLNNIYNNRHGITVSKRSDPVIKSNDIERNMVGIFITFSSYPVIKENNLIDNEYSLYLEYQSSQWEKERGDEMERGGKKMPGGRKMGAFSSSSQSQESIKPRKNVSDKVYANDNFWGDDITEEMEAGGRNISVIYDYFDAMEFVENGKKYKLDSVDYSDWATERFEHKR